MFVASQNESKLCFCIYKTLLANLLYRPFGWIKKKPGDDFKSWPLAFLSITFFPLWGLWVQIRSRGVHAIFFPLKSNFVALEILLWNLVKIGEETDLQEGKRFAIQNRFFDLFFRVEPLKLHEFKQCSPCYHPFNDHLFVGSRANL